jgi:hypothetical protein
MKYWRRDIPQIVPNPKSTHTYTHSKSINAASGKHFARTISALMSIPCRKMSTPRLTLLIFRADSGWEALGAAHFAARENEMRATRSLSQPSSLWSRLAMTREQGKWRTLPLRSVPRTQFTRNGGIAGKFASRRKEWIRNNEHWQRQEDRGEGCRKLHDFFSADNERDMLIRKHFVLM